MYVFISCTTAAVAPHSKLAITIFRTLPWQACQVRISQPGGTLQLRAPLVSCYSKCMQSFGSR